MPVCVTQKRNELLPGLWAVRGMYSSIPAQWETILAEEVAVLPPVSLPVAVAMGAAAVIIQNPETSRLGLFSWMGI